VGRSVVWCGGIYLPSAVAGFGECVVESPVVAGFAIRPVARRLQAVEAQGHVCFVRREAAGVHDLKVGVVAGARAGLEVLERGLSLESRGEDCPGCGVVSGVDPAEVGIEGCGDACRLGRRDVPGGWRGEVGVGLLGRPQGVAARGTGQWLGAVLPAGVLVGGDPGGDGVGDAVCVEPAGVDQSGNFAVQAQQWSATVAGVERVSVWISPVSALPPTLMLRSSPLMSPTVRVMGSPIGNPIAATREPMAGSAPAS
jgi:hypothetical protein